MKAIKVAEAIGVRYNLYGEIDSFNDYADFIEEMTQYGESDAVQIRFNSPGGRVDIGISLIHSIQMCKAQVQAVIEGPSYSMASILALACDSLIMLDNTYLMFHNYSTGAYGKGAELIQGMGHMDRHLDKFATSICSPFLSKNELNKIRLDQDVYIYSDDPSLEKRKARHFK